MKVFPTKLKGCYTIEPKIIFDERGYFMEAFNEKMFQENIHQEIHFVQQNQSHSVKGVLRGLHYQTGAHAQAKLIRVISGRVLDIAVDIRPGSETFGRYVAVELSDENQKQIFIPRGFAHGFLVLSETATFFYNCDNYYNKESEGGIIYNDPAINIDWQFDLSDLIISEKDAYLPTLENSKKAW